MSIGNRIKTMWMFERNRVRRLATDAGRLRNWRLGLTLILCGGFAGLAHGLPPEHEVQRLMLAVEDAVAAQQWQQAADYLNQLQQVEADKPPAYLFFRGQIMYRSGQYNEALSALENYIAGRGADGEHYTEALKLITRVEQARAEDRGNGNDTNSKSKQVAVIEPAGASDDRDSLRNLYMTDSEREALVLHLNSLLTRAGWREEQRIIRQGSQPDIRYEVSLGDGEIRIREIRQQENEGRRLSSFSLPVYGISPMVDWHCDNATEACWIHDPRDGSRWLRLARERGQAREIAATLGRLIRLLQQPGGSS